MKLLGSRQVADADGLKIRVLWPIEKRCRQLGAVPRNRDG